MAPKKAYLELIERSGSGPGSSAAGGGTKIEFQFNPKEFQLQKKASWKSSTTKGNKKAPPPEYTGPEAGSMSLEMFLDASDKKGGDVSTDVQKLFEACAPTAASNAKDKPLPPLVQFGWDKVYFNGYMESVSAKYTVFRSDGKPIRALCTIALKELPKEEPKQNPTSGTLDVQRSVVLVEGDSLASIAQREYGDPNGWRTIALANGVDDPLRVRISSRLLIPLNFDPAGED
jgi:nucleoid-associated protein YgaU